MLDAALGLTYRLHHIGLGLLEPVFFSVSLQFSAIFLAIFTGVQRGPVGCSVAQMVVRWLAVRQARVRISARHRREVPPTEPAAMKTWRRASANVISE
jgi:hypothetical protein